ncbi:hypothetical protein ACWJKU_00625 (plasmid) [Methylocaldum sp. MU1018]|jgi:hypothetical protein|uniref:hypothetical protein n=1 Tax=Betaproteobacteria TaxID=28216 RepID=UPI000C77B8F5|nr:MULTISPECIES: hypothetical protein [Betaproteobacteria]EIP5862349.1 hypothetical protein [Salmonella enterica]MCB3688384.1 hypothetical protein [Klebsiella pneumoniae]EIQ2412590.1 hypothetical protein [Salmonella enterica]MPS90300.1 hypothetical protein [Comamonas sp.]HBZ8879166.1 hypothetical protein [Klebsiella pneumoniae]
MKAQKKIIAAAVLSTTLGSGVAYAALYGFGPAETWTIQQIAAQTAEVSGNIAAFGTAFSTQMQTKFEQIISSVAVATKQEALSANIVSDGTRQAAEQLVNAVRAQRQSDQVATAYLNYNPATGQGYDPCGTNAKNKTMDIAFESAAVQAKTTVGMTDVAPGRLVNSTAQAMQARLDTHRSKFCTAAEASAGLCSASQLPGGDTNAALLFDAAPAGSLQTEARYAYIQHVLGAPDQKLEKSAGGTPAGEAFMVVKNRKDALLSVPAYSLAMIDAANTQSAQFGGKSPNEVLKLRVNQYFGGKEAEQWSGSMARQTQRGLLVEAAKMAGLEVWIHHKQYEQNQRLEANLAALLLASADKLSGPLEAQYQKVLADTANVTVK